MPAFHWINIWSRHPDAYRAEGIDAASCRVEVIWTFNPGIKQHHQVTASLTKKGGGSLWRVERRFQKYTKAFNFFERMRAQAEIRLTKLS